VPSERRRLPKIIAELLRKTRGEERAFRGTVLLCVKACFAEALQRVPRAVRERRRRRQLPQICWF
jgi:hypothetical protein